MTSTRLGEHRNVSALIVYLSQVDANGSVCDLEAETALLRHDRDLPDEFVAALRDNKIPPPLWARCALSMMGWLDISGAAKFVDHIVLFELDLLATTGLETNAVLQARLEALHRTFVERGPDISGSRRVLDDVLSTIRSKVAAHQLAPTAQRIGEELVDAIDLERGVWHGRPVDAGTLDLLSRRADEATLLTFARRLTNSALREEAERRVIRLRIAESPFPEVRDAAASVEEMVLKRSTNPVSLATHPALRATLEASRSIERHVVVQQRVDLQSATLLGVASDRPSPSVLPELPLRGVLNVEVTGIDRSITVCAYGRALDPTPCIAPKDLKSASSIARIERRGALRFIEEMSQAEAMALARENIVKVPILIGENPLVQISLPLRFDRPPSVVITDHSPGNAGPNLQVEVQRLATQRLLYSVAGAHRRMQAVVEWRDAEFFRVISRGAPGRAGLDGLNGSDGSSGRSGSLAFCPMTEAGDGLRGGDGEDGSSGWSGGKGGDGGEIHVIVLGPRHLRDETLAHVRPTIVSEGGKGGPGGRGGRGGQGGSGGSGGSGTSCGDSAGHVTFLRAGRDGLRGWDGHDGSTGSAGPPGAEGTVRIEWRDAGDAERS